MHERAQSAGQGRSKGDVHLVKGLEVKLAELLDVDGSTVVVSLVVVLRIVLVDLFLLGVLEIVVELIDLELGPPLFSLGEHDLCGGEVPLSSAKETTQAGIVVSLWVEDALLLDDGAELVERLVLGGVEVGWTSTLCGVSHWCLFDFGVLLACLGGVLVVFAKHSFLRSVKEEWWLCWAEIKVEAEQVKRPR